MYSEQTFTHREYLGDSNYEWLCDVTEPLTEKTKERSTVVLVGLNYPENKNNKKDNRLYLKQLYNYFDAECFRVVAVSPENAFEVILWEQPVMTIIEGTLPPNNYWRLLQRLRCHPLTTNLIVAVWGVDGQGNMVSSNLFERDCQPEIIGERLGRITEILQELRPQACLHWDYKLPQANPYAGIDSASFDAGVSTDGVTKNELASLLNNRQLRQFVDEVLDSWPTLQVAALLGEQPDLTINREILWQYLGIELAEADAAIYALARAGYLEPLEFEGEDILFATVAHPEKFALLEFFGQALKNQAYRLTLATLLLSRHRT